VSGAQSVTAGLILFNISFAAKRIMNCHLNPFRTSTTITVPFITVTPPQDAPMEPISPLALPPPVTASSTYFFLGKRQTGETADTSDEMQRPLLPLFIFDPDLGDPSGGPLSPSSVFRSSTCRQPSSFGPSAHSGESLATGVTGGTPHHRT